MLIVVAYTDLCTGVLKVSLVSTEGMVPILFVHAQ